LQEGLPPKYKKVVIPMIDKVLNYIKEHQMLKEGDLVVAGVSGGADSVCLLFVLLEIRKIIPIDIHVVHINHLIRDDAGSDADYVRKLCIDNHLHFTLVEKDVEAIAKAKHISTEEAGRNIRYEAFYRELGKSEGKIAVAHNKNDCCETFLFNLFRGSALKGLGGIKASRDRIIRPLMCLERREIEAYLNERNISYCIDSTNLGDDYTRNKIRHHILDKAVTDISPAAVNNISNACERINEAYELISDMTKEAFEKTVSRIDDNKIYKRAYHIEGDLFAKLHSTIKGYCVMETLSTVAGQSKDLEHIHVDSVLKLFGKQCGARINLPYKMIVQRDYTGIIIYIENDTCDDAFDEIVISDKDKKRLEKGEQLNFTLKDGKGLCLKILDNYENLNNFKNIPQKKYTKWFDYDKIMGSIVLRTRKTGDYLTVNSQNQKKTLKAYFIDEKIPQQERDKMLLLAEDSHIIWVIGARISNYYKVTENTDRILCVTYM
jgi:tRNA(Ile)-lysidine synthase